MTHTQAMRQAIKQADTSILTSAFREAYASTFTAEELAYLAEYSASDTGKRVQQKMPQYVSKVRGKTDNIHCLKLSLF